MACLLLQMHLEIFWYNYMFVLEKGKQPTLADDLNKDILTAGQIVCDKVKSHVEILNFDVRHFLFSFNRYIHLFPSISICNKQEVVTE